MRDAPEEKIEDVGEGDGESPFLGRFAEAVRALGRPEFDRAFLAAAAALSGCTSLLGYLHLPGRMIPLAAAGIGERAETATLASFRYGARLWQADPSLAAGLARLPQEALRCRIERREDLAPGPMAFRLLDFLGVDEQISFYRRVGRGVHILRLYRADYNGGRASDGFLESHGALLLAALMRHGEIKKRSRTPVLRRNAQTRIAETLSRLEHRLTPREIVVCTGILLGKTMEAISLDLGIAESSVRTYRKRAYRRLGISSQSQLFALCFNDVTVR